MKILMTGFSARAVGSQRLRYDYVAFSDLMKRGLEEGGHEVDIRTVVADESFAEYDRIFCQVGWISSLSSMHSHEIGLALPRMAEKAVLYYDDWRHSPFDDIADHAGKDKRWAGHIGSFRKADYANLTEMETDLIRDTFLSIVDPRGCPWHVVVPMHLGWANVDRFKSDGRLAHLRADVTAVDPTPFVPIPDIDIPVERRREWVFATLRNHDRWLAKIEAEASWPINRLGGVKKGPGGSSAGAFGKMKAVRPEAEVIQAYADSRGMLVAPYDDYLDGSGWWRPRYTYAFAMGAVAHVTGPRDLFLLGEPFSNTLEAVEGASDAELDDLSARQKAVFDALCGTREDFVETLDRLARYGS